MMGIFLFFALVPSAFAGELNLLHLAPGQSIVVKKPLLLSNSLWPHQKKGFYLDQSYSYDWRIEDKGKPDHCSLSLDPPQGAKPKEKVELGAGGKLVVAGSVTYGSYAEKVTVASPTVTYLPQIGFEKDAAYSERKTGRFNVDFLIPVKFTDSKGSVFEGTLSCSYAASKDPKKIILAPVLAEKTKGAFFVPPRVVQQEPAETAPEGGASPVN